MSPGSAPQAKALTLYTSDGPGPSQQYMIDLHHIFSHFYQLPT